jgi:hypothetical protein
LLNRFALKQPKFIYQVLQTFINFMSYLHEYSVFDFDVKNIGHLLAAFGLENKITTAYAGARAIESSVETMK